jgi:hypothetical protein
MTWEAPGKLSLTAKPIFLAISRLTSDTVLRFASSILPNASVIVLASVPLIIATNFFLLPVCSLDVTKV